MQFKRNIILLSIFACLLLCISSACASGVMDNSTYDVMDVEKHSEENLEQILLIDEIGDQKIDTLKLNLEKEMGNENSGKQNLTAEGTFTDLKNELTDFIENSHMASKIMPDGSIKYVFNKKESDKVHTFNLTRDYVYNDSTDNEL